MKLEEESSSSRAEESGGWDLVPSFSGKETGCFIHRRVILLGGSRRLQLRPMKRGGRVRMH